MLKKFLILNFGGIGDQILFSPVFENIKKVYNNPFITLVTESRSKAFIELTDLVDEVFICDLKEKNSVPELLKLLWKARSGKYDMVISSGASPIISIILFLMGIKKRIGYDTGLLSRVLLSRAARLEKQQYAANMYLDLVADPVNDALPRIKVLLDEAGKQRINAQIGNTTLKKIVIHPGASKLSVKKNIFKCWSTDNWLNLIETLHSSGKYRVILTGGPDDAEIMEVFNEKYPELILFTRSIKEFAYAVSISDILVCVDSAPMHIGVGLEKRTIAIFGPTDEKKLIPLNNPLFTAVRSEGLNCRPCLWDKRQSNCENSECLNITPDQILDVIKL